MKAVLEFTLPEEAEEFRLATEARRMRVLLGDWENYLREQDKYNPEQDTTWEKVRDQWYRFKEELGITSLD